MIFEYMDRIVFAGDSVTDMGSQQPVGEARFDQLGFGFVRMIDNILTAWHPELKLRIINSGLSGNTSRDLLARFDQDVAAYDPHWLCICIGINDVWRQFDSPAIPELAVLPEDYRKNVEEMILWVKDTAKGIILCTPYFMEPNQGDAMRARIDEYCQICRELAEKHGCRLVDFQKMYDEFFTKCHPALIAWDRIHPNQKGAMLMAREVLKACEFDFSVQ